MQANGQNEGRLYQLAFPCCDKTLTKTSFRRKGCTWIPLSWQSPLSRSVRVGTQGRNLEVGTEVEARRNVAHWLVLSDLFSHLHIQALLPGDRHFCPSCPRPLTSGSNQENGLLVMSTGYYDQRQFFNCSPLFSGTSSLWLVSNWQKWMSPCVKFQLYVQEYRILEEKLKNN